MTAPKNKKMDTVNVRIYRPDYELIFNERSSELPTIPDVVNSMIETIRKMKEKK